MAKKTKWTILTYIGAHNDLQYYGQRSFDQILGVGSTPEVIHGVLLAEPYGAARYIVGDPGKVIKQDQLRNYDSADPKNLISNAQWVFSQYPAEHYGLILWSHGSGWRPEEIEEIARKARHDAQVDVQEASERAATPGSMALFRSTLQTILKKERATERAICFDDGTGHSLDTLELDRVTSEIANSIGQKLDFVGMDACLMASIEVAYQIRNSVRYLAASEESVPLDSWPYDLIFGSLRENPAMSGEDLACLVVNRFIEYYTKNPPSTGDVTTAALDLGHIGTLVDSIKVFADTLLSDFSKQAANIWNVQHAAMKKESLGGKRKPNKFDFHLWDIGTLAAGLTAQQSSSDPVKKSSFVVIQALRSDGKAVLAEGHRGDWFDGIGGVSVYLVPPGKQRVSPYYSDLSFAKDTRWLEMLKAYHEYFV